MSSIFDGIGDDSIEQLDENLRKWFKEKWVRFGPDGKIRGACARGDDSEGKPKCLPQKKAQNLGKKGRKYAASKKRREDPNPERRGKAKNVATKKKTNEGVPFDECPKCCGPIVHESMMNEKQDACYHKVKSRYKVWPSAYASGALVQCRKKGASNWGTGGKKKNESNIMKGLVDEASGTPGGLERYRTPAMVNATMQQSLYKRELAPIKAAEKKRKEAEYRKNNPSVSVPSIQIGASNYPIHVIHNWIGSKDLDAAVEFAVNKFAYRQSKDFKTEIAGDPDFQKAVKNFFNVAEKSLNHRDSTRTKSQWDGKIRAAPRETDTSSDGFDAINKINDALLPYYKKYGVDKTGRRVPPNFNYNLGEGVIIGHDREDPQVAVLGGAGSYKLSNLKKKALGEAKQLAADIANGEYKNSAYNVKQLANTLNTIVAAEEEMEKLYFGEAVDPKLGYDPDDYDDDFEEIPLQTATHITTQDIPMQGGGDLPAGTELKMHKRSSDPGPDNRARFHFFAVLDNGNPTRLVRLPKKLVKSVTMHEDYTGEFAAEVTPAINPYGGLKDNQFRGAISETPTDNPTGASGEGGWRKYKPKPAGEIEEDTAYAGGMGQGGNAGESYRKFTPKSAGTFKEDELDEACWKGYHKEGNKKMFGKTYPNCVKNKKSNEDIEEDNARVARKPGQPANSKKHSDLYTDENPKGTITGLKFATAEDARASVSKIRNSGRSHAHKIQAAVAMEQRAKAAGKAEAASIYRKYINATKKTNEEEQLDEKCWDTHKQVGMKNKGGRQVPNCVPKESAIMKGLKR